MALLPVVLLVLNGGAYYVNDTTTAGDVVLPGCTSAPTGDATSTSCGTCLSPCATPQQLYNTVPLLSGDTVYVNAGTYKNGQNAGPVFTLTSQRVGVAGRPIVFKGVKSGERLLTVLDGSGFAQAGIKIDTSWVTLENFVVTNTGCSGLPPFGSGVFVSPQPLLGIVLQGIEVFGTACSEASLIDFRSTAPASYGRIVGNLLHDNAVMAAGIHVTAASNVEIVRNVIVDNSKSNGVGRGIWVNGAPSTYVLSNLVNGNGGPALVLSRCTGCAAGSTNVQVQGNTFWANQSSSSGTFSAPGEVVAVDQSSLAIENNIIGASKGPCINLDTTSSLGSSNYNDLVPITVNAGLVVKGGATYPTLSAWKTASGKDTNSISADPLFASPSSHDFHVLSTAGRRSPTGRVSDLQDSPVIDLGDPATFIGSEPAPNGGRVELGFYGASPEASLTPVTLAKTDGDLQFGPPNVQLPTPLRVRVTSKLAGRGEAGVAVNFTVAAGTGSLTKTSLLTDLYGFADTLLTPSVGLNKVSVTADVGGTTALLFTATGIIPIDGGTAIGVDGGSAGGVDGGADGGGGGKLDGGSFEPVTITSTAPTNARCKVPYTYAAAVNGDGTGSWSIVTGPDDAKIDKDTGLVTWLPPADRGARVLEVQVTRGGETSKPQKIDIDLACDTLAFDTQCGCGASGGLFPGLFGLWLVVRRRLRRADHSSR